MAAAWFVTILNNEPRHMNQRETSNWIQGQTPVAEGLGTLYLIREMRKNTAHSQSGEIVACSDAKNHQWHVYGNRERKIMSKRSIANAC